MRDIALNKLLELNTQLTAVIEQKEAWQNEFERLWRIDISFLRRYNDVVLDWIISWKNRLYQRLSTESVFETEHVDSDVYDILSRARLELKVVLHLRNQLFKMGLRDVTCAAHLPANTAYLFAVEAILPEEESACVWLMPWVKRVTGGATSTDIKSATEDPETNRFLSQKFVMDDDGESLISVEDCFYYAACEGTSADSFFKNKRLHTLFKNTLGLPALNYIRALHYFYNERRSNTDVFGYHVVRFATALNEFSVNRGAKEYSAKTDYEDSVIEFYQVWCALPLALQEALGNTKIDTLTFSFKEHIDTLFITVPAIDLGEAEKAATDKLGILKCSAVMSSILFSFIESHAHWYEIALQSNVSRKCLYTDADLADIKSDFLHSFSAEPRIFSCPDAFVTAIQPVEWVRCDQFFRLASLIPSLSNDSLSQLMTEDLSLFCNSAEKVMHFLLSIKDSAMRAQCFMAFSDYWGKYFKTQNRFIMLCAFFDASDLESIVNFFSDSIKLYFINESGNHPSIWIKKQCETFSFVLQTVFRHFVMGVLIHAPVLIENVMGLLKCLQVFDSEKAYTRVFDLAPHCVTVLSTSCSAFVRFLVFLEAVPRKDIAGDFSAALVCSVLFPRILPSVFSDEAIEALWDKAEDTVCCSSFFSSTKIDKKKHADLLDITTLETATALTAYEAAASRVRILNTFITENRGGTFLAEVKAHYGGDLVSLVQQKITEMDRLTFAP